MAVFKSSANAKMVSVSAATTSQPVVVRSMGGRPGNIVATIFCHGTFVAAKTSISFEVSPALTSAAGVRHWVPLNMDPGGVHSFITSGVFTSSGPVNIELGHGSEFRATVATTATGPVSLFYQL